MDKVNSKPVYLKDFINISDEKEIIEQFGEKINYVDSNFLMNQYYQIKQDKATVAMLESTKKIKYMTFVMMIFTVLNVGIFIYSLLSQ